MAIQTINIGYLANDGTGDDLREAFIKVNENFAEMDSLVQNTVTNDVESVGTGKSVYKGKLGNLFQFKSLIDGHAIQITESGNELTITGDPGMEDMLIVTDNGSINVPGGHPMLPIQYGQNISTAVTVPSSGPPILNINVDGAGLVELDPHPKLGGDLMGNNYIIRDVHKVEATIFTGDLHGTVYGIDVRDIDSLLLGFDFGSINNAVTSLTDFLAKTNDIDMMTIASDQPLLIDSGYIRLT